MKTKKTCSWILLTALVVSLCAGCSGNNGASESASTGRTERSGKYEVGEGIPKEDITEFTYTISNSTNPPRYEQYRFFMEDGAYRFSFVQENVAGDTGSRSGELASASGTLELTDTEWDELYDCLEGGSAKKKEEDRNAETGGTYYTYQLYWNGDREKYRKFSFASSRRESEFEALCEDYVARADMAVNGNEAQPGRLSADATPEDIEAFLAGGSWSLQGGGDAMGTAAAEMIFGADDHVTFRYLTDYTIDAYVDVFGTYSVSYETDDRPCPDLLTLSFEDIPDELTPDYHISDEDAPTEDFSFYIAAGHNGFDCLNLYITGNSGYSVIADRLFKEMNQTSETWRENSEYGVYPNFESGWVFTRYTEGIDFDPENEPALRANDDAYVMIWEDGNGMMVSYMKMEEHTDVFAEGDRYYYFSYDGAPELISGHLLDFGTVTGHLRGSMPYNSGMGRMPCVMAHITTGPDATITSFEYYTYAGFMHWEKWTGNTSANATDFTSFDEVLAYYREVLPTIDPYVYDESVEGTFAADLYTYYIGYWPADPLHNFYYTYTDLNGDGTNEMLVGAINDQYETVHQILSIGKQDGRVYMIASAGYRSFIDIHTDGTFSWGGSYSAGAYTDFVYRLNDAGDMREFIEGYKYDDLEELEGGPWFRAIPTGEMDEGFYEMNYEPITEAEAEGMMEKYTIQSLRWSMLAD